MYGIRQFTAVINPPQAAILAVGEAVRQPVVRDDRDDEAVVDGDRDADADVAVPPDGVSCHEALTSGCAASAVTQAGISRSVTLILTSAPRRSLACARNASSWPASATTVR